MFAKKQSDLLLIPGLQCCGQSAPCAASPLRHHRQALQHWTLNLARPEVAVTAGRALTRAQCENLKSMGYVGADFKCPEK